MSTENNTEQLYKDSIKILSDLIGFKKIKITEDMIGQEIAQFVSIEIKTEKGKLTTQQNNWLNFINKSGGITGVARSIKDVFNILSLS